MRSKQAVALSALVAVLVVTFGHLLQPFDFLTFLHAGSDVLAGRLPYASPSSSVFKAGHAFVYPLYVAWTFAPLAVLPAWAAEVLYGAASLTAIVISCRLLGRSGLAAPNLVLVCSTTIIGLQMGTLNAFLLLGLASAWKWRESRPRLAGVVLGAAATAKLFLIPVLLWPLVRRRYGQATAAVASAVALALLSCALGSFSPLRYLTMLSTLDAHEQVESWSFSSFLQGLGAGRGMATAGALVISAACVIAVWSQRRRLSDGQVLAAVVLSSLLISPILWSSYLLLLVVPLLLVPDDLRLLAAFALGSWLVVTPDAASFDRVLVGVAVAVAVVAAAVVAAAGPRRLLRWRLEPRRAARQVAGYLAAAAVLALALVCLPAAARSALPAVGIILLVAARCLRPMGSAAGA